MKLNIILIFPILFVTACAGTKASVGVGAYTPAIYSVSNKADGSVGVFAPFSYPIGAKVQFDLSTPIIIAADYTPMAKAGPETELTSRYTLVRVMVEVLKGFSIGPSITMHTQKGNGDVIELNNGGSTSDFAIPDSSSTSKIFGLNFAYNYAIGSFVIGNEIFLQEFMNYNRWNFAWLVSLHYQFGGAGGGGDGR